MTRPRHRVAAVRADLARIGPEPGRSWHDVPTPADRSRRLNPHHDSRHLPRAPDPHRHRHRRHVHRRRRPRRGHRASSSRRRPPRRPSNPADGFLAGVRKVLDLMGASGDDITAVSPRHDRRDEQAARGQGRARSASSRPRATSSSSRSPARPCPTATATPTSGSSRRASSRPTTCKTVGGRIDFEGNEMRPFDEERAVAVARWFRSAASRRSASASCTPTPTTATSSRCARCCAASTPRRSCRSARRCCASTASTSAR